MGGSNNSENSVRGKENRSGGKESKDSHSATTRTCRYKNTDQERYLSKIQSTLLAGERSGGKVGGKMKGVIKGNGRRKERPRELQRNGRLTRGEEQRGGKKSLGN